MKKTPLLTALATLALAAGQAWAGNIAIVDPSFEDLLQGGNPYTLPLNDYVRQSDGVVHSLAGGPDVATGVSITGWNYAGSDDGAYHPDNSQGLLNITNVDGSNVGYLNTASPVTELLTATLQAGTYTLSVDVGYPSGTLNNGNTASGSISLLAGATPLSASGSTGSIGAGTLATITNTYTIAAADPLIGQLLTVSILKTGGGSSLYFDNVSLNLVPVPEPATGILLAAGMGLVLAVGLRKRG